MEAEPAAPGLFDSVRNLLAHAVGLAHARLDLLSTELREELTRLVLVLFAALVTLFFTVLGVAFTAIAVMVAVGEGQRLAAAVLFALLFFVLGALGAWFARRVAAAKPRLFDASLTELRKDYDLLRPQP